MGKIHKPGVVGHIYNPSIQKGEGDCSEFKVSPGERERLCLNKTNQLSSRDLSGIFTHSFRHLLEVYEIPIVGRGVGWMYSWYCFSLSHYHGCQHTAVHRWMTAETALWNFLSLPFFLHLLTEILQQDGEFSSIYLHTILTYFLLFYWVYISSTVQRCPYSGHGDFLKITPWSSFWWMCASCMLTRILGCTIEPHPQSPTLSWPLDKFPFFFF